MWLHSLSIKSRAAQAHSKGDWLGGLRKSGAWLNQRGLAQVSERRRITKARLRATVSSVFTLLSTLLHCGQGFCGETDQGTPFGEVCASAVRRLDEFTKTCEEKARVSTRIFYPGTSTVGTPETHYLFFDKNIAPSHFGLGCTLNLHHKPDFVGIYYGIIPSDFDKLNSLPIVRISGAHDVVLSDHGSEVNMMPMRKILMARENPCSIQKIPKIENGYFLDNPALISSTAFRDQVQVYFCFGKQQNCLGGAYIEFFGRSFNDIVGEHSIARLIGSHGELLVRETDLSRLCGSARLGDGSFGVARDLCALSNDRYP